MMRPALLIASATVVQAQTDKIRLGAFHCGNPARLSPQASQSSLSQTFKVSTWTDDNNIATFFTSSHCENEPVSSTFTVMTTCASECKTARACATKVWPEHCEQGCEKDCSAHQSNNWNIFAKPAGFTGNFHVELTRTAGGIGSTYECTFTRSELQFVPDGAIYCVGKSTGATKETSWPKATAETAELGAPWVKISILVNQGDSTISSAVPAEASATGALVDSEVTTGTESANKIDGSGMHSTCDGHCGTFAPGFGSSCSATTEAQIANLGPGWHPAAAADCYCSCTTDCARVGDCCDDYSLCSATDLTIVGGVVQTQAPTVNTNAGGATGDPFTEHAGKRTQFYLPLGRRVSLLKFKHVELLGEAKASAKKNDDQQWFKGFEVKYNDQTVVIVETADTEPLLRKASAASTTETAISAAQGGDLDALAALRDRLARAKMELATTQNMRENAGSDEVDIDSQLGGRKTLRSGQMPLGTLNVTVAGRRVVREVTGVTAAGGDVTVQVSQDQKRRIGSGFMESAWIEAPGIGFQLQSALAQKFDKEEDKVRHMHVNLKFNELNATGCTGLLPEIWGVQPMTAETIKHLSPLSARETSS